MRKYVLLTMITVCFLGCEPTPKEKDTMIKNSFPKNCTQVDADVKSKDGQSQNCSFLVCRSGNSHGVVYAPALLWCK